ncbi:hypothetical protein HDV02_005275 [Globomyces sp. JEL0801]|nr:hypothetical protein HDV02_005275 [Globomyces sp. JEL0801]
MPPHGPSCGTECDHSELERGEEFTLYSQIDLDGVQCLNAVDIRNTKLIFKTWENRFDQVHYLESDSDETLIIQIPFTSSIKLKSIAILGFNDETFINRQDVDFDTVDSIEPTQEWDLIQSVPQNVIPEYPTKLTKFSKYILK